MANLKTHSKLTQAQVKAMCDLVEAVRNGSGALAGSLPEAPGQMQKAGPPLAKAIRKILEAFDRCEGC